VRIGAKGVCVCVCVCVCGTVTGGFGTVTVKDGCSCV
jgi:hypothetical protein